jgi:hypothetical protein
MCICSFNSHNGDLDTVGVEKALIDQEEFGTIELIHR